VRRLFDCAGCSRGTGQRRASIRAVISRSTRSKKDSITASLYSGPSSLCVSAAARISCGSSVLMGESPPVQPRPGPLKDKIHLVTELVSAARSARASWPWPLAWPRPSGPLRPVEAPGSRAAAGASHAAGCEAPLRLKGPARVVDRPGIAQVGTASTDGEPPPPLIYGSRCLPPDDRDGPEATVVRLGQCTG